MAGAFGIVGWYLGSSPTSVSSESNVRVGESGAMPWETDEKDSESKGNFKYRYHPHGDKSKPLKEAPSALNEVIIPNVTLPAVCTWSYPRCTILVSILTYVLGPPRTIQQVWKGSLNQIPRSVPIPSRVDLIPC